MGSYVSGYGAYSFAVDKYLDAIQLMPDENEFLAMIYDNLAECYLEEDLYDVAMEAYKKPIKFFIKMRNMPIIR